MAMSSQKKYFVHPSSYVDEDVEIGDNTKIWHFCHIQAGARIGRDCSLGQNVNLGNRVRIGDHVKIQNNVSVYEGVELEDFVFCGPSMVFTNILNPRCQFPQKGSEFYLKTLVKQGASLGANCTVLCGITIGAHAFVGAGAVVTRSLPDHALAVGNPARLGGWMCCCGFKLNLSLAPDSDETAICPKCRRHYRKQGMKVSESQTRSPSR